MISGFRLAPITTLPADIARLGVEATGQGYRFVDRLIEDWTAGSNRFEQPGERLLSAFAENELVGICGLNRDPYVEQDAVGRLRHLYVMKAARLRGVGAALIQQLLEQSVGRFHTVRLRTDTEQAAAFYRRLGFAPTESGTASHVMTL